MFYLEEEKSKTCWLLHSLATVFLLTLTCKGIFTGEAAQCRRTNGKNTIVSVQKIPLFWAMLCRENPLHHIWYISEMGLVSNFFWNQSLIWKRHGERNNLAKFWNFLKILKLLGHLRAKNDKLFNFLLLSISSSFSNYIIYLNSIILFCFRISLIWINVLFIHYPKSSILIKRNLILIWI